MSGIPPQAPLPQCLATKSILILQRSAKSLMHAEKGLEPEGVGIHLMDDTKRSLNATRMWGPLGGGGSDVQHYTKSHLLFSS